LRSARLEKKVFTDAPAGIPGYKQKYIYKLGAAMSEMLVDQLEKLVIRMEGISNNKTTEFYRYDRIQGLNCVMGGFKDEGMKVSVLG
jgi:hypothetical protein